MHRVQLSRITKQWINHVQNNYDQTIANYFDQWYRFTTLMKDRPPLITTTDYDIWIANKIFNQIKITQHQHQQQLE